MKRSNAKHRLHVAYLGTIVLFAIAWTFCSASTALAQENPSPVDLQQTVTKLLSSVNSGAQQDVEGCVSLLQKSGEAAVPSLARALSQADDKQKAQFVRVLSGIGADSSTSLLVELLAQKSSPTAAQRALSALDNRTIRRQLSPPELAALMELVSQTNIVCAGQASRVLAKCVAVPMETRLVPIIARFRDELASPSQISKVHGAYLSPEVYARNQFLLAFSDLGKGITRIAEERQVAGRDSEAEKWWVLALGFAGDKSVAPELERIVMTDPDRYVRCVAVRAYARSAGHEAIPLLESLTSDQTVSEYTSCIEDKGLLIQDAANDELARLR